MTAATAPPMRDRYLGCLLGHAVGDGLGAPVEGLPAALPAVGSARDHRPAADLNAEQHRPRRVSRGG